MENFRIVKPKSLNGLKVNIFFDIDSDYKSRLKLLNYHSPKTTLGFIPILAIKDITGDPAKNGKITIISRIKEDAKLVMENDNFATATKLLIQYQLLASKSCMPTDHDLLNDAIDAFRRPTKQGTHRIPDPSGKSNRCAIVDVGGKCVFLIYWEEHLLLIKWWVHLADQSELDRWSEEIIETVNSDTVYMEPLGKTWPLSYIDQIKLKKTKVRRLYAVKVLEDRLHCHHEKKDTRTINYENIEAISIHRDRAKGTYRLAIVHSKQHNQSAEELLFSVDTRPKFIEDAINRLISWRTLDATDAVFCSNAYVSINFDKRYEHLNSIIMIRNRYIEVYPLDPYREHDINNDSIKINIRDIIDPMKRNYSVSKDNDNEKVELEKITIKTPKINVQIQFSTQFGTSHFKGHLNAIICFTDGTIDEQMILGGIPRLVKTCTSYIESYGLRMTGIYRVSGAAQRIKTLEDKFNLDPLHFDIDSTVYKVHDVAVLLKRFFRQLKVPLIRPDDRWFEVHRLIVDDEKQVQAVCLATQIVLSYSEITQSTVHHMISHLYLITLLECDNQMGSTQLSIIFGTTFFGTACWQLKNDLDTTAMKNRILEVLIREARNVCLIPDKQFKQMIQITEQLTENCFTNIKFNQTTFRFHPNKSVDEIRQRLQSDNDHTELVLTSSVKMITELIVDPPGCLLGDLSDQLEAQSVAKSEHIPRYIIRHPENGTLVGVTITFTSHMVQWSTESFCTQIQRNVNVFMHDEQSEHYEQHGMVAIELTNGDDDRIVFMVQHGDTLANAILHFYHGLRPQTQNNQNNSLLDHSDLIIPL